MSKKKLGQLNPKGDIHEENAQKLIRGQLRIAELELLNRKLQSEVNQHHSIRWQLKNLYHGLDNRIMMTIDSRGYGRRTVKTKVPVASVDLYDQSSQELLRIARIHDAKKYFHFNPTRTSMRLRYRLVSKIYRTSRDIGKLGIKRGHHLYRKTRAE